MSGWEGDGWDRFGEGPGLTVLVFMAVLAMILMIVGAAL